MRSRILLIFSQPLGLLLALVLLALPVSGCGTIEAIRSVLSTAVTAVISKDGVVLAVSAFHAAERTATVYIRQKHCPPGAQQPTCMSPPIREQLAVALEQGQRARDGLIAFAEGHPGAVGDQAVYDALRASTSTLKSIFATYKIGGAS